MSLVFVGIELECWNAAADPIFNMIFTRLLYFGEWIRHYEVTVNKNTILCLYYTVNVQKQQDI